ncbi:very short patch repair endonuclease [Corallococcus exercitus]
MPPAPPASTPEARRRLQELPRKDTVPELALRSALHRLGLRFRVNIAPIPGRRRADVVFRRAQVAVYVDGCFWHGCPTHLRVPRTNREFWEAKFAYNRRRDADTDRQLARAGWRSVRVWEHESPDQAALKVLALLTSIAKR